MGTTTGSASVPGLARTAADASLVTRAGAYVALTKPRIIELLLVTTVPPMVLAAGGWPGLGLILATLVGGTLVAGAANAFNMVWDRDMDAVMARTRSRPLPAGIVSSAQAVVFASALAIVGTVWLWVLVGALPALLTLSALVFYVLVYTIVLKRRTVQNIVIGGAAGAVPVLVGWAAVTGDVAAPAWVLFAVVVLWTPPHFWALAIVCDRDYAAAGVPMLPVVRGRGAAARGSLHYAVLTAATSLALPLVDSRVGWLYVVAAAVLGGLFVLRAIRMVRDPRPAVARKLFTFSVAYLAALFAALVVDQLVRTPGM